MQYRRLGRSDLNVSVVAMGCWALAGESTWGKQDEADSIAAVQAALDQGVNFFDTAAGYGSGESERILGTALGSRRTQAIIATKLDGRDLAPDRVAQACEQSLRHLGTDVIDLYQIHWPKHSIPLGDTMGALEKLKNEGKIRAIGVCNFGPQDLADLRRYHSAETNQIVYSLLARSFEFEIQTVCVEQHLSILCYSPLAMGLLTGKFASPADVPAGRSRTRHFSSTRDHVDHGEAGCETETFAAVKKVGEISQRIGRTMAEVSLAWLLHQRGVTAVLAGARNVQQVQQNARSADLTLSPELLEELCRATEPVKQELGPNADIYSTQSRIR